MKTKATYSPFGNMSKFKRCNLNANHTNTQLSIGVFVPESCFKGAEFNPKSYMEFWELIEVLWSSSPRADPLTQCGHHSTFTAECGVVVKAHGYRKYSCISSMRVVLCRQGFKPNNTLD